MKALTMKAFRRFQAKMDELFGEDRRDVGLSPGNPLEKEMSWVGWTELLTDFELNCPGHGHRIALTRYRDSGFILTYNYITMWHEPLRSQIVTTINDKISIKARHDKLMEHMSRGGGE